MKYAVIATGGKQYRVTEGQVLEIDRVDKKEKDKIEFGEVLLLVNEGERKVGQPKIAGVTVKGEVLGQIKGEKIHIAKFKAKVRYRKHLGFRAQLTKVKIEKIGDDEVVKVKKEVEGKPKRDRISRKKVKA